MNNNFIPILNTKRNIKHLACLHPIALNYEIEMAKLIHPNGEEDISTVLESCKTIEISSVSQVDWTNPIWEDSGIYGIRCGKKNNYFYIGETLRPFKAFERTPSPI